MIINLGNGYTATWAHGSHYVNVMNKRNEWCDCISFSWEKNYPTFADAWSAFFTWYTDQED